MSRGQEPQKLLACAPRLNLRSDVARTFATPCPGEKAEHAETEHPHQEATTDREVGPRRDPARQPAPLGAPGSGRAQADSPEQSGVAPQG